MDGWMAGCGLDECLDGCENNLYISGANLRFNNFPPQRQQPTANIARALNPRIHSSPLRRIRAVEIGRSAHCLHLFERTLNTTYICVLYKIYLYIHMPMQNVQD